jgi:chemotaxis protein MotB
MHRWHTQKRPSPPPPKPTTVQLRRKAIGLLKKRFGTTAGFDPKTGALDCIQKPLFARGKASVLPQARSYLDAQLRQYITALLDDPQIRAHLRAIVIEGHTDSTGGVEINQRLSWQRASTVVKRLVESEWGAKYALAHYIRPQGVHHYEPILIDGVENKPASRRIRLFFELAGEPTAHPTQKERP